MTEQAKSNLAEPAVAAKEQDANPMVAAIEHHKAAWAAFSADDRDDSRLSDAEDAALMQLAETPCVSDAQFVEKMKYMLDRHDRIWGQSGSECDEILAAIRQHTEMRS